MEMPQVRIPADARARVKMLEEFLRLRSIDAAQDKEDDAVPKAEEAK